MSACSVLKRSINLRISFASIPCTGTGKNMSISVGSAARAVAVLNAAAAGMASTPPRAARRVIGSIKIPSLDAGKRERRYEPALKDQEKQQQRASDEKGAGSNDPQADPASVPDAKDARPTVNT